jgi:hypothetical protein
MNYLARLRQLENSENTLGTSSDEPPKPPEVPSDPFAGSHLVGDMNISSIIDPISEREHELHRMVILVGKHHGFNREDYDEAIQHALEDQVLALTCFTALARQAGLIDKYFN